MSVNKLRAADGQISLTYEKAFWLFICASIAGVIIEGLFCLFSKGRWESHVVSVFGAFNTLYGAGAVIFYTGSALMQRHHVLIRTAVLTAAATLLELISGIILRDRLGMEAWDYHSNFMNYRGLICLSFTLSWGAAALLFSIFSHRIDLLLCRLKGPAWRISCILMSIFMALNILLTSAVIARWSSRHYGYAAENAVSRIIDRAAPDEWMSSRFMEWRFII